MKPFSELDFTYFINSPTKTFVYLDYIFVSLILYLEFRVFAENIVADDFLVDVVFYI